MARVSQKIRRLVREFPGLQEAVDLTIDQARFVKKVTTISVKRVDSNLLSRVLLDEDYIMGDAHYRRSQDLWVLREGDAVKVDIRKQTAIESSAAHWGPRQETPGETIGSRLGKFESIENVVLTDEVYDTSDQIFRLEVTIFKPAKGSTIAEDVAWERMWADEERERMESGYYEAEDEEKWPEEYTEINIGDPSSPFYIYE